MMQEGMVRFEGFRGITLGMYAPRPRWTAAMLQSGGLFLPRFTRVLAALGLILGPLALSTTLVGAGTSGALTADPASVSFGDIHVGTTGQDVVTITNSSGSPVTIHRAENVGGQGQDFAGVTGE